MENMMTCPKGHFYDGEIHSKCPVCEQEKDAGMVGATEAFGGGFVSFDDVGATGPVDGNGAGGFEDYGPTEPIGGNGAGGFDNYGPTEPVGGNGAGGFDNYGPTEPVGGMQGSFQDYGPTEPAGSFGGMTGTKAPDHPFGGSGETMRLVEPSVPGVDNYSDQTMPLTPNNVAGFTPVVGWLVCIDGPDRGHDYRIRTGYNRIGRAEHMDICIRGDKQISRERHALIAYDDLEKLFFFSPSEGVNIVRVNGKAVMGATELHSHDVLTIGSSKLIFVPLCGENFDWNKV